MSRPDVSFEFFPPRSAPAASQLWATITALEPLEPHFVSVTYGAGGTTREQTVATVLRIHTTTRLNAAAHLTCVAASRDEIDQLLQTYWEAGIRRIVALRGDPPGGGRRLGAGRRRFRRPRSRLLDGERSRRRHRRSPAGDRPGDGRARPARLMSRPDVS